MNPAIVDAEAMRFDAAVTLIAAGPLRRAELALARARAPHVVAVDGGADRALRLGITPDLVLGDLDSLSDAARAALGPSRLRQIDEQETTDFDKALRGICAPLVIAVGVMGGRHDHALAVLSGLMRHQAAGGGPVLLLGPEDVIFAAPPDIALKMRAGDRLSLYPLAPVTGRCTGLDWPIEGLQFTPMGRIGTSNRVTDGPVTLEFDAPGMLIILPRARLDAAIRALRA
ncbi:thiamine diphosphokinase [Gemmobacter serpentinus]|uniref:thiamine diphosphokinase n=1 Tax=Gemmobacter serpentinus TaxID=2652247 RepID=UPI001CF6DDB5|nr:thiamine diphosphokinase [Gemmobacter serpentinus]